MPISPPAFATRLLPISLGQVVGMGCGILGVQISSHLITPADYGEYGLYLSLTPLGMWVVHAGLIKSTGRYWGESASRAQLLHELWPAFIRKLPWLTAAVAVMSVLMMRQNGWFSFGLLLVTATLFSATAIAQAALQSAQENWRDFAVTSTSSITRTLLPPIIYVAAGGTASALYAGLGLHALLVATLAALMLRPYWSNSRPTQPPQLTQIFNGPLFAGLALVGWIMAGLNRWIVAAFFGSATAGYFVLAGNISLIAAGLLGSIFTQYFQPALFAAPHHTTAERRALAQRVDRIALGYNILALTGLALLRLIAPWFIGGLINENYRASLPYIMPAGFFLTAALTHSFYHTMLVAGQREKACGPVDLSFAGLLAIGSVTTAALGGEIWWQFWLLAAPLFPAILSRSLARFYLLQPT